MASFVLHSTTPGLTESPLRTTQFCDIPAPQYGKRNRTQGERGYVWPRGILGIFKIRTDVPGFSHGPDNDPLHPDGHHLLPLIPVLAEEYNVSIQEINLTVTVYVVFQAISPVLFASLADSYGRRPVLLALTAIYVCGSLGLAVNRRDYAALMAPRALQSVGGSPTSAVSYGIVADVSDVGGRGALLGPMLAICNAISVTGPLIGGAVAIKSSSLAWVFLALLILAALCFLLTAVTLPETSRAIVGNGSRPVSGVWCTGWSHLRRLRQCGFGGTGAAISERPSLPGWKPQTALYSLRIIFYPDAAAIVWTVASTYSVYYTFQVATPTIFSDIYNYNELLIGAALVPGLVGMVLGGLLAGRLMDRNYAKTKQKLDRNPNSELVGDTATFPIETARFRLCAPILAAQTMLVTGYGWAVHYQAHVSVLLVLQFIICGLSTLLSHTASALLVDVFPDTSSSAYASGQVARCGLSAVSSAVLQPIIDSVGRGWYFTIFAIFTGVSGFAAVYTTKWWGAAWRLKRAVT